jgi:hypothetical protein
MQRPIHHVRHTRPAALAARLGLGTSCALDSGTRFGGFVPAGTGAGADWMRNGLEKPGISEHFSGSVGQDRRERYRQRGRSVARP